MVSTAKVDPLGQPEIRRPVRLLRRDWGTLIGYPASYGSDVELNDHHFHYGYFIRAAAEVARRDPAWAEDENWGGMVKLLIRDIASTDRDGHAVPLPAQLRSLRRPLLGVRPREVRRRQQQRVVVAKR